ncbi:BCL2 interacting protein 4 isoform X1 [Dunckerocampus dactyliophorus]|uniref:BCL2 interacting protein 4 isoform X1 n=1 Tax=Dunckerocampus dactyliophorus TaxID=161453 RepID=UPI002406452D|nr:BCL2 interacting protein 4 isoform X1 [Dunckerocampus dactyliophorus]
MELPKDALSEESLQGSWVELHFSGAASQSSQELLMPTSTQEDDVENMLLDAQHESARNSSGGSSQCNRSVREEGEVSCKIQIVTCHCANSPLGGHTPLLAWRSSGGSSLQSDEDLQERRQEVEMMMTNKNADWIWDLSSRPENNPPKEFLLKHPKRSTSLSIRNTSVMKKGGMLSADFLQLFLPSLIISHILAVGLGIYIGKRLTSHGTL